MVLKKQFPTINLKLPIWAPTWHGQRLCEDAILEHDDLLSVLLKTSELELDNLLSLRPKFPELELDKQLSVRLKVSEFNLDNLVSLFILALSFWKRLENHSFDCASNKWNIFVKDCTTNKKDDSSPLYLHRHIINCCISWTSLHRLSTVLEFTNLHVSLHFMLIASWSGCYDTLTNCYQLLFPVVPWKCTLL